MTQTQGPICGGCYPPPVHNLHRGPATTIYLCPPHQRQHDDLMQRLDLTQYLMSTVPEAHTIPMTVHIGAGSARHTDSAHDDRETVTLRSGTPGEGPPTGP